MAEVVAKDLPEVISAVQELNEKLSEVSQHVGGLLQKVESGVLSTSKGVSFLDVKFHLLLSYLINLVHCILLKTEGRQLQGDPVVERLVEIRTVIEKLRPIDQKMKYQIDKLIKAATLGRTVADNDPLRFKPNPDNMMSKLDEQESGSEEESDEDKQDKPAVYVPPKVSAVPYDEDFGKGSRRKKEEDRARQRALKSSLLQELRDEYSEAPQEVKDDNRLHSKRKKDREEMEHRIRYEEENLIRLTTKKKKKGSAQMSSTLDDLTSFADLSALRETGTGGDGGPSEESARYHRSTSRKTKSSKWKRKSVGSARKRRGRRLLTKYIAMTHN